MENLKKNCLSFEIIRYNSQLDSRFHNIVTWIVESIIVIEFLSIKEHNAETYQIFKM